MPSGKGTYGRKRGRPPKKSGKKMTKAKVVKMIKSKAKKRRKKK